jgi:hypothetical protein
MMRTIAVLLQFCILAQVLGCTRTISVPVNDQLAASEPKVTEEPGARISGYVTSDGVSHRFKGWVRLEGDEFVFQPAARKRSGQPTDTPEPPFRLPRTEVVSFIHEDVRVGRTILVAVFAGIAFYAAVFFLTLDF